LDSNKKVVYLGTFAKTLYPSIRMGYVIADQIESKTNNRLVDLMIKVKSVITVNTPGIMQAFVGGLLIQNNYSLVKFNEERVSAYRSNRDLMLAELSKHFPNDDNNDVNITWNKPEGGFFVIINLPFEFALNELKDCAKEYKVIVFPVSLFSLHGEFKQQVRLAFTNVSPELIKEAIDRFAKYVKLMLNQKKISRPSVDPTTLKSILNNDPSLTELNLSARNLTPKDFQELGHALASNTVIKTLQLANNQLDDSSAFLISKNKSVSRLVLNNNKFTANGVKFFLSMPLLTTLELNGNPLCDAIGATLAAAETIKEVHLRNIQMTDQGLIDLSQNKSIEALYLGNNAFSPNGLASLPHMTGLRCLEVSACNLTNSCLEALSKADQIEALDFSVNAIDQHGLGHLDNLSRLSALDISRNPIASSDIQALMDKKKLKIVAEYITTAELASKLLQYNGGNFQRWSIVSIWKQAKHAAESLKAESPVQPLSTTATL
jgi:(S)-3,5-dihydroxyphenylglycine transaminase